MTTKKNKTTNEKPVKIHLPFKDTLNALLVIKPEKDTKKQKKPISK